MNAKPRIAHLAGANATIQNSPPLVTSNKARAKYGLPLVTNPDGSPLRFDVLRAQRLAAPVTVYVEQFSAHPLERDAAELYGPPDGYVDAAGTFHRERRSPDDTAGVRGHLAAGGRRLSAAVHGAAGRRPAVGGGLRAPRGARGAGPATVLSGRVAALRGDRSARRRREGHRQPDLGARRRRLLPRGPVVRLHQGPGGGAEDRRRRGGHSPPRCGGATSFPTGRITWARRRRGPRWRASPTPCSACSPRGKYAGAVWTQGSPRIEETVYWLNLLVDTTLADLRQRLAAPARAAQQRRRQEHRRLRRVHRLARVGGRGGAQPRRASCSCRTSRSSRRATCRRPTRGRAATWPRAPTAASWARWAGTVRRS